MNRRDGHTENKVKAAERSAGHDPRVDSEIVLPGDIVAVADAEERSHSVYTYNRAGEVAGTGTGTAMPECRDRRALLPKPLARLAHFSAARELPGVSDAVRSTYPDHYVGRGIIISAGGTRYLTCAWVLIRMLRHLGCKLPIEVWYLGEREGDPKWIDLVRPLGVRCVNAHDVRRFHPHPCLGGWESKAYAIRHSPFEEVLFLDADNVPVVDPTYLFELPEYSACGAVFWPHVDRLGPDHPAWQVFGVPYRDEWEQESGQILIDKRRSWPAVCLAELYNRNSWFYYRYVYGDKDTFRFAWHRMGLSYAMPEPLPAGSFFLRQGDFQGRLVFQHRVAGKWMLRGNRQSVDFMYQKECIRFLRELAAHWEPREERLPARIRTRLRGARQQGGNAKCEMTNANCKLRSEDEE